MINLGSSTLAVRISKKALIIGGIILSVIVLGAGGYVVWRLNQPEEVTPEEAAAASKEECEAKGETYCGSITCPDGTGFGDGCWSGGGSDPCGDRKDEACEGHQSTPPPSTGGDECGGKDEKCCDDDDTPDAYPYAHGCDSGLHCLNSDGEQAGSGERGTCKARPSGSDEKCDTCTGSCNREGCSISGEGIDCKTGCNMWPGCFYCSGQSHAGCGANDNGSNTSSTVNYSEEYWCHTWQCDSNAANGACSVVYVGDRGEWCVDDSDICKNDDNGKCGGFTDCPDGASSCDRNGDGKIDENDLDWVCEPEAKYLQVQGRVYCQDPGGELYAIQGASIEFEKEGNRGLSESLTTDSNGSFRSAAGTTTSEHGGFNVRFISISEGTLPTGVDYEDMDGPYLDNADLCPSTCSTCTQDYEQCSNLADEGINYGFRWVFHDCSETPPNPDWQIEKVGSVVCYEEGTPNVYAEATYVISIRNRAEGTSARLLYVENYYDETGEGIQSDWITSTNPQATSIDDEKIVWNLEGDDQVFEYCPDEDPAGSSCWRTFEYTVRLPEELFGKQIYDHAIGHPEEGEELHAYEDVVIVCKLPPTGIFEQTGIRIALGAALVLLGFGYYKFGFLNSSLMWLGDRVGGGYLKVRRFFTKSEAKRRWEKKLIKRLDRKKK